MVDFFMSARAAEYLAIPADYAAAIGGLHWSDRGDAVVDRHGATFAVAEKVWQFLEGFVSIRPPLHFAHVLHLMHILPFGSIDQTMFSDPAVGPLTRAVLQAGKPLRTAGVLCAHVCRDLPRSLVEPNPVELRAELLHRTGGPVDPPEVPPMTPASFEQRFLDALEEYGEDELLHWLKFGQAPEKSGERLAEEIERRPPNVEAALARAAENRERLAGALALVPALNGALTLPPRRLDEHEHELPVGGYADVTTRGEPERLLPTQFALEGDEFIRRFAEHELLFFRREEPGLPTQEELVVLLDQGVRTWGSVRLALAGAVFAFARIARRRGIPLRLTTTGNRGELVDPLTIDAERLGQMLEASDLSANPTAAMTAVLDAPCERLRDVVLLTHPRSLIDGQLADVAGREREGDRLFAVSVDSQGRGQLDQLREGRPVALSRFRLDLTPRAFAPPKPPARAWITDERRWTGDVEPVPFPFWFGPVKPVHHLAFDHEGDWLLVATGHGLLHAQSLSGAGREILPRGYVGGDVLTEIDSVLGVAGGFVVCGKLLQSEEAPGREIANLRPVAFHYNVRQRHVTAHVLPEKEPQAATWFSFPDLHSIACRTTRETWGVDLANGNSYSTVGEHSGARARKAAERAKQRSVPAPRLPSDENSMEGEPFYFFNRSGGRIKMYRSPDKSDGYGTPMCDGKPILKDAGLIDVHAAGDVVAVHARLGGNMFVGNRLLILRRRDGAIVREFDMPEHHAVFRLSDDGILVARHARPNEVMVHDTRDGVGRGIMFAGRVHTNVEVARGPNWLVVSIGAISHLFTWYHGDFNHCTNADDEFDTHQFGSPAHVRDKPSELGPLTRYDSGRFLTRTKDNLRIEADRFGHVLVLDAGGGRLIAMFWFRRDKAAAWLPDGTRWGAPEIVGTPSPNAAAKLAQALRGA